MQERIVIAVNNFEVSEKLRNILSNEGYYIVATTKSGNELTRIVRSNDISIVLIGYKLTDMTIMDVYNNIGELTSFLAIVNEQHKAYIQEQTDIFCITSPINNLILLNSIDMIIQSERRFGLYKKKINNLEQKIADRKFVDKAKGKLMKREVLSEEEAFRYIQKQAMDRRKTIREIADEILEER